jgi:hypothetical protein
MDHVPPFILALITCSPCLAVIVLDLEHELDYGDTNISYPAFGPPFTDALETFAKGPLKGQESSRSLAKSSLDSRLLHLNVSLLVARDAQTIPTSDPQIPIWERDVEWKNALPNLEENFIQFIKSRLPICDERGVLHLNLYFRRDYMSILNRYSI